MARLCRVTVLRGWRTCFAIACLLSLGAGACAFDTTPSPNQSSQTSAVAADSGAGSSAPPISGVGTADPDIPAMNTAMPPAVPGVATPTQAAAPPPASDDVDAGAPEPERDPVTVPPPPPATAPTSGGTSIAKGCSRDELRQRADAYLLALSTGDTQSLRLHPEARYTENGQTQMLGLGLWLRRPTSEFARHVLDEVRCSSVTVSVVGDVLGRTILGLRLRYLDDQLLEIEAQVVVRNTAYYDPDGVIPSGPDPWLQPIPDAARMKRDALLRLAERYFDSTSDPSLLPPHAPACRRRQNGALLEGGGGCGVPSTGQRFEQRRFPVIDETLGVITAVVMFRDYVGMYLFKAQSDTIQSIEVIGGAAASSTGW